MRVQTFVFALFCFHIYPTNVFFFIPHRTTQRQCGCILNALTYLTPPHFFLLAATPLLFISKAFRINIQICSQIQVCTHMHTLTLFRITKHNTQSYGICTRASTFSNSLYVVDVQMVQKRMQLPAVMRLTVSPNSHRNILTLLAPLLSIDEYVVSLHCYLLDPFFLSSQLHIVCYVNYYAHSFRLSCLPNVKMNMTFS